MIWKDIFAILLFRTFILQVKFLRRGRKKHLSKIDLFFRDDKKIRDLFQEDARLSHSISFRILVKAKVKDLVLFSFRFTFLEDKKLNQDQDLIGRFRSIKMIVHIFINSCYHFNLFLHVSYDSSLDETSHGQLEISSMEHKYSKMLKHSQGRGWKEVGSYFTFRSVLFFSGFGKRTFFNNYLLNSNLSISAIIT